MRKKLVAGNWKMHGSRSMADGLVQEIVRAMPAGTDVLVFPPFPFIAALTAAHAGSGLGFGAQDVSEHEGQGAYTGEVSAAMVADIGAQWTLVGHSERRHYHRETDEQIARKFAALDQREAGETEAVIARQLHAVVALNGVASFDTAVIAYEPVWAIGTGRTATPQQAQDVHAFIRSQLAREDDMISRLTRLLYGGSVKAANAAELFAQPDVDGGLIGGASLVAADFLAICNAAH
jgi:triosephosphate isomerase